MGYDYTGPLSVKKMTKLAARAFMSFRLQRQRCYNPKCPAFKYYGAKGIAVEYSSREFIGWYLAEVPKFKGSKPTVGRKDHSLGYSLSNIEIQSHSANTLEVHARCGPGRGKYPVKVTYPDGHENIFESATSAAKETGISVGTVGDHCRGRYSRHRKGYIFSYV